MWMLWGNHGKVYHKCISMIRRMQKSTEFESTLRRYFEKVVRSVRSGSNQIELNPEGSWSVVDESSNCQVSILCMLVFLRPQKVASTFYSIYIPLAQPHKLCGQQLQVITRQHITRKFVIKCLLGFRTKVDASRHQHQSRLLT